MNDLKHAFRQLCKHPFTSGVIVLTIALLTGAASVIYASILEDRAKLMPFPRADRVVKLWRVGEQRVEMLFPADLTQGYLDALQSFDAIGASEWSGNFTLTGKGEPASYSGMNFSTDMFDIIGHQPVVGRFFEKADAREQFGKTVVISDKVWKEKFDADVSCIGSSILLNEQAHTIIGVMPDAMRQTHIGFGIDLWMPLRISSGSESAQFYLFGRLKDDSSIRSAQAEMDVAAPRLEAQHAPAQGERANTAWKYHGARVVPVDEMLMSNDGSVPSGYIATQIFAVVVLGSVVGIAGFNVTNLLLARSTARSREMAVRLALGARRRRIAMLLLTESLMLAIAGGIVGLVASWWLMDLLRLQAIDARFDVRIYLMALGGACLVGALAGMSPALRAARVDLNEAMKDSGQTFAGARRHRLRNFLVASEVAMAVILTLTAGLTGRAYLHMSFPDPGTDPQRVYAISFVPRQDVYRESEDRIALADRAIQALREIPGIEAVGVHDGPGDFGYRRPSTVTFPDGAQSPQASEQVTTQMVSGAYPEIVGMPLLRGRTLSDEATSAAGEVLVNERFAEQFFQGRDPIGESIRLGSSSTYRTIVGVVKSRSAVMSMGGEKPEVLTDYRSDWNLQYTIVFRTRDRGSTGIAQHARSEIGRLDANQSVHAATLMADQIAEVQRPMRNGLVMLGSLAGFGLLLALMGVYGVVANSVVERTRELGIRMALGADRHSILRLVARQGGTLVALGAIPGMLVAIAVLNALPAERMNGFGARDPVTYLIVMSLIALTGCLAAVMPARRATRINPMEALRHE